MNSDYQYDLIVIGSGPAGEKGAVQAAYFGKKVALIEQADYVGGAGINTGTLPSKTLRETALYYSGLQHRGLYGIDYSLKEGLSISNFMYRAQSVMESERNIIQRNLEKHKVDMIWGKATLQDAHTVSIHLKDGTSNEITTNIILIATGSSPYHPPGVPFEELSIHDSDSILQMDRFPKSLTIVGGGVIGSEYAGIFTALGVEVTMIESRDRILPFLDAEIVKRLQTYLENLGLRFLFKTKVVQTEIVPEGAVLTLDNGEKIKTEIALFTGGRQSNIEGLGLHKLGIQLGDRGVITTNEKYQTSVPNIYAAGDVVGFPALASTSMEQARVAMVDAFDLGYKEKLSPIIPLAVYTIPEISMIGLTEEDCLEKNISYQVGKAFYSNNPRGQILGDMVGMLKLIFAPTDKKLLGVHIMGEMASELIHLGAHVMAENGNIDVFIDSVFNYPTLSDAYKYAAYDGLGNMNR